MAHCINYSVTGIKHSKLRKKEWTFGLSTLHSAFMVSDWLDEAAMADEGKNKKLKWLSY